MTYTKISDTEMEYQRPKKTTYTKSELEHRKARAEADILKLNDMLKVFD